MPENQTFHFNPTEAKPEPPSEPKAPSPQTQTYVAPTAPRLRVKIPLDDGSVREFQFEKGQLEIPSDLAPAFDKLLTKSIGLQPLVQKVDIEAARRLVAEHERQRRPQAATGAFSTAQAMQRERLDNINAELQAAGVDDQTYVKELGDADMLLQEHRKQKPGQPIVIDPKQPPTEE